MKFPSTLARRLGRTSVVLAMAGIATHASAQTTPFDGCGTLVQGVTCPVLFSADSGGLWLLGNLGGFQLGDYVHVVGSADPFCITFCQQGGCIANSTIALCNTSPGSAFCFGDGTGTPCPCGNNAAPGSGSGCLHSFGVGGKLQASGVASIASDTVVLAGSSMPNAAALYFQGTTQQSGGAGATFGDGLRCAGGTVVRLGTKTNVGGSSQYPTAGDMTISVKAALAAGDSRTYQIWYRNAASFCTTATFNLSNGFSVVWQP
jgi:hypothetical protein